jgi:hypothetical protein
LAIFGIAEQISGGAVSLVTIMIQSAGWRGSYLQIGTFFSAIGIIDFLVTKEPPRSNFTFKAREEKSEQQNN